MTQRECYCKQDRPREKWIQCSAVGCETPWWHVTCAGLENITDGCIKKLKYTCPMCVIAANNLRCLVRDTYQIEIAEEIGKCLPDIVKTVVKETTDAVSKSYAETVKRENKALLKDTVKSTSENALKETMKFVDANLAEQRKRTRNVIISGVNEAEEQNCEDTVFNIFNRIDGKFEKSDIANCKRIGSKKDQNENGEDGASRDERPRLILVTLRYEQDALYFHNSGFGRKYGENCWINPDLTKAERDARYKLRCARREKLTNAASSEAPSEATESSAKK